MAARSRARRPASQMRSPSAPSTSSGTPPRSGSCQCSRSDRSSSARGDSAQRCRVASARIAGVDVVAEVERPQRLEHVRGQPRRIELRQLHQVVGLLRREPRGHREESRRRHRREQRGGAHRTRRQQPLDDRRAHRMADQHRRRRELRQRRARRRRRSRRARRRTASRGRRTRRGRAATARARRSPAPANHGRKYGVPAPARRSSRRGRTAAAACGALPLPSRGQACASGLRGSSSTGSIGEASVAQAMIGRTARQRAAGHGGACYDARAMPCRLRGKTPPFCQNPTRVRRVRRRLPPLRAARVVPRRRARPNIPATSAGRCRRSAPPTRALVIVGLAPGMHGANATGRPFTGDYAGILLYETLHALRLRVAADRDGARRRPRAHRLPDHQRGQMPAARATSRRRRRSATCNGYLAADLATLPARRRDPRARPHRARRDAARARPAAVGARVRARRAARARPRRRALRQLSLQPLQHEHRAADAGDVPRGVRRDRRAPRARRQGRGMSKVSRLSTVTDRRSPPEPPPRAAASTRASSCASLPHRPGVYRMFDAAGETLYVGKARDLKKRVSSYFQKSAHETRIALMLSQVARVETTVTRSEGEALLLENNLIKARGAALQHPVPRRQELSVRLPHRRPVSAAALPSRHARPAAIATSGRFRAPARCARAWRSCRRCSSCAPARTRCSRTARGPACCTRSSAAARRASGSSARPTTREDVQSAVLFLQGKASEVLAQLKAQMDEAAAALEFERAARCATRSRACTQLQSRQFVESATAGDIDVVAAAAEQGLVAVNVVMIRGGRHVGDRTFFPQHADADALRRGRAGVPRRSTTSSARCRRRSSRPTPTTTTRSPRCCRRRRASAWRSSATRAASAASGSRWRSRTRASRSARSSRRRPRRRTASPRCRRRSACRPSAQRIECFDVSHTMGERAVASCVIFDRLAMQTSEYRRFNVTPAHGGDDYAAMREALTRRCARIVAGEYPAPDLLVIDGGKGQVAVAAEVLAEQGLHDTRLIGIAKGPERKAGRGGHRVSRPRRRAQPAARPSGAAPAAADSRRGASLRDPGPSRAARRRRAPRRRCRRSPASAPRKRQALLAHFGGLKGVQAASVDDLARVPGISRALAERIFAELH